MALKYSICAIYLSAGVFFFIENSNLEASWYHSLQGCKFLQRFFKEDTQPKATLSPQQIASKVDQFKRYFIKSKEDVSFWDLSAYDDLTLFGLTQGFRTFIEANKNRPVTIFDKQVYQNKNNGYILQSIYNLLLHRLNPLKGKNGEVFSIYYLNCLIELNITKQGYTKNNPLVIYIEGVTPLASEVKGFYNILSKWIKELRSLQSRLPTGSLRIVLISRYPLSDWNNYHGHYMDISEPRSFESHPL